MDIFAEKCLKLKNAGILCRIFACLRLNLCARTRKKLAYGQMKNIISGADARPCASANGSDRCTVSPTVPNAYELLSTEAFGARVSDCRPLDYGECALFRKLNLFRHCLLSLFRNTGARAPLFGEPPVALCIVSRMCLVSPGAYVTPYRISRVCACAYILCVYIVSVFRYLCADPRRLEFLAEVSCAYLVRHAQSAGGKYNFAELLAAGKTGAFRTEEYTLCKFKFTTYACAKHITLPTVECKNLTVECNLKA